MQMTIIFKKMLHQLVQSREATSLNYFFEALRRNKQVQLAKYYC